MEQPVALFTAAGRGIGTATARKLACEGWAVAILSPSGHGAALVDVRGGLGVTGSNLQSTDLPRWVDESLARWGRVDAVVDGAGLGPKGSLLQLADADSQSGKEFYLINVVCIARLATPVVQKRRVRVIVNAFTQAS